MEKNYECPDPPGWGWGFSSPINRKNHRGIPIGKATTSTALLSSLESRSHNSPCKNIDLMIWRKGLDSKKGLDLVPFSSFRLNNR